MVPNTPSTIYIISSVLLFLLPFALLIFFLISKIQYFKASYYVLYERFWYFSQFRKAGVFRVGYSFVVPMIYRIKRDEIGKVIKFSQDTITEEVEVSFISKNGINVQLKVLFRFSIMDINIFIDKNNLHTNNDYDILRRYIIKKTKNTFKPIELKTLNPDTFDPWTEKIRKENDWFTLFGIDMKKISVNNGVVLISIYSDYNSLALIAELFNMKQIIKKKN